MSINEIFLKSDSKPSYTERNGLIHLNLTESVGHMKGGSVQDNIIHLNLSENTPQALKGGSAKKEDSTEYFNRLASKIVSKATGGFSANVVTKTDDTFLSSETINEIKMVGGAKSTKTFNFMDFKEHLKRSVASKLEKDDDEDDFDIDDDEDDDDELFGDTDDDDDTDEETDELDDENEEEEEIKAMRKSDERVIKKHGVKRSGTSRPHVDSESMRLSDDDNEFVLSASASSPKLMAYRKVGQGRRFI
jgi:hypothetical protein